MITIYEELTKSMEMPCPVKTVRNGKKELEKSLKSQQKRAGPKNGSVLTGDDGGEGLHNRGVTCEGGQRAVLGRDQGRNRAEHQPPHGPAALCLSVCCLAQAVVA